LAFSYRFRDIATYILKHCTEKSQTKPPNRCRCRHGYYWQPIWSRQRPIGCYHRQFLKT